MNKMNTRSHPLRDGIVFALVAGAGFGIAGSAFAQDAAPAAQPEAKTLDRIEVTGSNIRRTDSETASPVQIITRAEIERTGKTNIADYLQTLTVDGAGSIPKSFGNGFAAGGTGISLRGLGAGATLVLLNGRRMAPFGLADDGQKVFTDLSTIPLEAVERVDVLKDGASAIYGSDAIAGVVNIILRKDFNGAIVKGSYGTSQHGGGSERKGSLTWGTGDLATDGYNFFFNVEASKTDRIRIKDRHDRKWIGTGDLRPWGYDGNDFGGLAGSITNEGGAATSSLLGNIRDPATGLYQSLTPDRCAEVSNVADQTGAGGGCIWDPNQVADLIPEESYVNFFARGTFALSDNAELYTEFGISKKNSKFDTTPTAVSGATGYPGGTVNSSSGPLATVLSADHPDNPLGVDGVRLRYSPYNSVGTRTSDVDNDFVRFLVGVKGTAGAWDYDVAYLHSQTDLVNDLNGYLRASVLKTALTDPVPYGGWLRVGVNAGLTPASVLAALSPTITAKAHTELDVIDFKASRSLADLKGGSLGLAFGGEYRRQTAKLDPVTYTDVGDIIGLGYSAYDGEQTVGAAYAELVAPVLPSLELSGAVRVDSYKDGDTATTPKVGIKWTPADWIALRGTYAEGFRAPNPAETAGSSVGFTQLVDEVRCPGGVPINGDDSLCAPVGVAVANLPNPSLKPEKSKSYTLGLVLQPTPSTSLTLDAWQIQRRDEITQDTVENAIAAGTFERGDDLINGIPGTGTLLSVSTPYVNLSSTKVRGIDFDISQKFDMNDFGKLTLDLQWSHVISFELDDGSSTADIAGSHDNCNVTNCIGTPDNRINFGTTWDIADWSVSGVVNYRGKFDNTEPFNNGEGCVANFANGDDAPGGCEIPSFYTVDLSANWHPGDAWEVFGSVQNLTDRIAPIDPTTYGGLNYNPLDVSGAIGRYYTVGLKYTFK
jgi:iron complex outermembrane receptor protein